MKLTADTSKSVYLDPALPTPANRNKNPYNPGVDPNNPTTANNLNSLIDDNVRVYKGGSWKDVAYWMSPGTRRYLDKNEKTSYIGFRCGMIMAGERNGEARRKQK